MIAPMKRLCTSLKLVFGSSYWRYVFSFKETAKAALSTLGIFWLLIEPAGFVFPEFSAFIKEHWAYIFVLGVVWVCTANWPRTSYTFRLKGTDISIRLSIGNIFDYSGNIVIPINTSFDTSFENNLISKKSVQGQFTLKYFKEPKYLDTDINKVLETHEPPVEIQSKTIGRKYRYEIGKVVPLSLKEGVYAYLLAIGDMNDTGVASTSFEEILSSLAALWEHIKEKGDVEQINIPVLGTGRGRIMESRETMIKTIAHSFIAATTSTKRFVNVLNIVVQAKDYKEFQLNLREITDFIRLKCAHYEHDMDMRSVGKAIE